MPLISACLEDPLLLYSSFSLGLIPKKVMPIACATISSLMVLWSWYLPNEPMTYKTDYWSHAQKVTCHPCHVTKMRASKSLPIETSVTIPAVTPTFSSTSRPTASPEAPRNTSSGHVPLGSHVIHPRAPTSRPVTHDPVSRPRWVRLRESPPSTPDAPDEPAESSTDPRIDSAVMTEDLTIYQELLSEFPMRSWSAVSDINGHQCPTQWHSRYAFHVDLTAPADCRASRTLLRSSFHSLIILRYAYLVVRPCRPLSVYKLCSRVGSTSDLT